MSNGIQLIVGLANPGPEYQATRHNAGSWFIEHLIQKSQTKLRIEKKCFAAVGDCYYNEQKYRVAIPTTYMNESGRPIQALTQFYKISLSQVLVIHDELDFEAGIAKLKQGGGHGGHNGLRNIMQQCGKDFWRMRIGIGHPGHKDKVTSYVLAKPNKQDKQAIDFAIQDSLAALPELLAGNFEQAMLRLHSN